MKGAGGAAGHGRNFQSHVAQNGEPAPEGSTFSPSPGRAATLVNAHWNSCAVNHERQSLISKPWMNTVTVIQGATASRKLMVFRSSKVLHRVLFSLPE
jgi:hypothetical protein